MQNIIVEKEEDVKEIIKFLEEKKAGKATFLPLSKFNNNSNNILPYSLLFSTFLFYYNIINSIIF